MLAGASGSFFFLLSFLLLSLPLMLHDSKEQRDQRSLTGHFLKLFIFNDALYDEETLQIVPRQTKLSR